MRGIGAAARRGAHLPASYAAAFSSFSGIGGGGSGGGVGRGRGSGSGPSPFGQQPRAPGRPIPDDDGADPFSAPSSVGRGRGETAIPSFSAFSGGGAAAAAADRRCRRRPPPRTPPSITSPSPSKSPLRPPIPSDRALAPHSPRCHARSLPLAPAAVCRGFSNPLRTTPPRRTASSGAARRSRLLRLHLLPARNPSYRQRTP
ncbi:hypothetical protein PR202_ga14697 [Eleusine coracana subsp. coracana]|uniref:Uncharacterized protein n=1 Tax=Eleusine coracana subsp. coracana TaxID=191504 RepID=A0AAV5CIC1_ELECO|nr:hypothetical protein PR202_ga14697 [Eleusine coracana subsp. coracana]